MTHAFEMISSFNGRGGKVRAIVVYNQGKCVSVSRRQPFEAEAAWVIRALKEAA